MVKFHYSKESGNIKAFYQNQKSKLSTANKPVPSENYSFGSFRPVGKNPLGDFYKLQMEIMYMALFIKETSL